MRLEDIPGVIALQRRAFPKMPPWTANQLKHHMKAFPEGQLVAVDPGGHVIGSASSLIILWADYDDLASWNEITGYGSFSTHDPERGKTLYGADIGVDPAARGQGVGSRLYEARKAIVRRFNLKRMIAGGRIPGYAEVAATMGPDQYIAKVIAGKAKDPILTFQLDYGFSVLGLMADHQNLEREARNFATLIEWRARPAA